MQFLIERDEIGKDALFGGNVRDYECIPNHGGLRGVLGPAHPGSCN